LLAIGLIALLLLLTLPLLLLLLLRPLLLLSYAAVHPLQCSLMLPSWEQGKQAHAAAITTYSLLSLLPAAAYHTHAVCL
jgi:hypothetical protein